MAKEPSSTEKGNTSETETKVLLFWTARFGSNLEQKPNFKINTSRDHLEAVVTNLVPFNSLSY